MPTTILDGETYEQARHRRFTEEAKVIEKMQQDEIIRMAREAGFETEDWANGAHVIVYESGREIDITNELECFYELAYATGAAHEREKQADISALPIIIEVAVKEAVIAEREACAKVCEEGTGEAVQKTTLEILLNERKRIAKAIRDRGDE